MQRGRVEEGGRASHIRIQASQPSLWEPYAWLLQSVTSCQSLYLPSCVTSPSVHIWALQGPTASKALSHTIHEPCVSNWRDWHCVWLCERSKARGWRGISVFIFPSAKYNPLHYETVFNLTEKPRPGFEQEENLSLRRLEVWSEGWQENLSTVPAERKKTCPSPKAARASKHIFVSKAIYLWGILTNDKIIKIKKHHLSFYVLINLSSMSEYQAVCLTLIL